MKPRIALTLAVLGLATAATVQAAPEPRVEVFKSPSCGCCGKWVEHMQQAGFRVTVHEVRDVSAKRRELGMPERYGSCHSARVGAYLVEGHVPAQDVKRLMAERPAALGLAVPAMPPGSPGMEGPRALPYDTLLVRADGSAGTFARH
jgi:hypothetical protein